LTYSAVDHEFMALALRLAVRGLYSTDPNPRVGCVLVRDGAIVGQGWHERAGEPHAEAHALAEAGAQARGSTCYVTLEPCSHHGKTPPCADALIEAGVAKVVAAMPDPNPAVAGKGIERLREAGIECGTGLLREQAAQLNPGFISRMRHGRPYVRCKLAMSLDGRTAMASGESQWITGPEARADVQRLRARSSAIMTGAGTVLADDPSLTVRGDGIDAEPSAGDGQWRQPLRVVVDPRLSIPPSASLLRQPGYTLIATTTGEVGLVDALASDTVEVVRLSGSESSLDLESVLKYLASLEINEVLLETGATLSGAMLQAGLVDELIVYMAPVLMGDGARALFRLPGIELMDDRIRLEISDVRAVGQDWRITAKVFHP